MSTFSLDAAAAKYESLYFDLARRQMKPLDQTVCAG
jgi:hypothetical protein